MTNRFFVKKVVTKEVIKKVVPNFTILKSFNSVKPNSDNPNRIYIELKTKKTLFKEIRWGSELFSFTSEQGGLLIGKPYYDRINLFYYSVVEFIIPLFSKIGVIERQKYSNHAWKSAFDTINNYNNNLKREKDVEIIGWYHTHKGEKLLYMSEKDMNTHNFFTSNWQFGIVLNPQHQSWKAFNGQQANECYGFIIKN